jgi:LAO/AO transport system kinase
VTESTTNRAARIRALARAISVVERGGPDADALEADLGPCSATWVIGVTGPPGVGKSTLVDRLIGTIRSQGSTVAVLAVDPSSPISGGAILGDRVRMTRHSDDDGVYIRSMAARGHPGGLAAAARSAVRVLGAHGFDVVIVETVGAGQNEVDVASLADCVVVVVAPGVGDGVQAIKAGILEIADIYVVNMADRPGASQTVADIGAMLSLAPTPDWVPPVLQTVAIDDHGVDELWAALERHRVQARRAGIADARRRARRRAEVTERVLADVRKRALAIIESDVAAQVVDRAAAGEITPIEGARRLGEMVSQRL